MTKITEAVNPASKDIDTKPVSEVLKIISNEDTRIAEVVASQLPAIEKVVDKVVGVIRRGGRVFMVGAGTSGRLCVLEAAEVPPTFGTPPSLFQGLVAGGNSAVSESMESVEDDPKAAQIELQYRGLGPLDLVLGVSASGSTFYTLGAIRYAQEVGAATVGLCCNTGSELSRLVEVNIEVVVGPEVVAGSTRMKGGTAQKMVLNMLTTATMIKLGRVHDGYMVGVQATNNKLVDRSRKVVSSLTKLTAFEAVKALESAEGDLRVALVMNLAGVSADEARRAVEGWVSVREAIRRLEA